MSSISAPIIAVGGVVASGNFTANIAESPGERDAFGKLRVTNPLNIFDWKSVQDSGLFYFNHHVEGGGSLTFLPDLAAVRLSVGAASGDRVVRQSKRYCTYQPGKSQLIYVTGRLGGPESNKLKRIGYFDDANGLFFEQGESALAVVLRGSVSGVFTEERVAQSSWNIDPLDGSGPSAIDLNTVNSQIYAVDFEWLGVGDARMGVQISGAVYYCHQFNNANVRPTVYMSTPNLPVRWEIVNTAAGSASSIDAICCSVQSEGGLNPLGTVASTNMGINVIQPAIGVPTPILSIRLKQSHNRATLVPLDFDIFQASNNIVLAEVYLGEQPSGIWNSVSPAVEAAINPTGVPVNAVKIWSGYIGSGGGNRASPSEHVAELSSLVAAANFDGTITDAITIVVTVNASNTDVGAGITWKEIS